MTVSWQSLADGPTDRITVHKPRIRNSNASLADDIRDGLTASPKSIPPKYFYDDIGSELFQKICATPEYYPARVERKLLQEVVDEIFENCGAELIVELGSGSSVKSEILLNAASSNESQMRYLPIDVSEAALTEASERLANRFPCLRIDAVVADYEVGLKHTYVRSEATDKLFVFLGGSIGNFQHDEAVELLTRIRGAMDTNDRFIIGADRVKDQGVLHHAYNDKEGITAEFNLNVLRVINRALDADFELEKFEHSAFYDGDLERIEMHLVSRLAQQVRVRALGLTVEFENQESILTEISRKFTFAGLERLLREAGMAVESHYEPENRYFSLIVAKPM